MTLPKNKTHSGTKKRFRVTGGGAILSRRSNRYHLAEKKSSTRMRRLDNETPVNPADRQRVKRLLGR